jgi:hypothetical protein
MLTSRIDISHLGQMGRRGVEGGGGSGSRGLAIGRQERREQDCAVHGTKIASHFCIKHRKQIRTVEKQIRTKALGIRTLPPAEDEQTGTDQARRLAPERIGRGTAWKAWTLRQLGIEP